MKHIHIRQARCSDLLQTPKHLQLALFIARTSAGRVFTLLPREVALDLLVGQMAKPEACGERLRLSPPLVKDYDLVLKIITLRVSQEHSGVTPTTSPD